ncbi:hypothetical protein LIER_04933 [Lithospermum erythrorhizon]|uniref:Uncharacterized protein n=1 Tax=Lithospermum erythrorhizon TaxID=34254 RepID=A0AAV3NZT3_LITER
MIDQSHQKHRPTSPVESTKLGGYLIRGGTSQDGDERGADPAGCHSTSGIYRRRGKLIRSIRPDDNNGDASATCDKDGGIHHSRYGEWGLQRDNRPARAVVVRTSGLTHTSQAQVPNQAWHC